MISHLGATGHPLRSGERCLRECKISPSDSYFADGCVIGYKVGGITAECRVTLMTYTSLTQIEAPGALLKGHKPTNKGAEMTCVSLR